MIGGQKEPSESNVVGNPVSAPSTVSVSLSSPLVRAVQIEHPNFFLPGIRGDIFDVSIAPRLYYIRQTLLRTGRVLGSRRRGRDSRIIREDNSERGLPISPIIELLFSWKMNRSPHTRLLLTPPPPPTAPTPESALDVWQTADGRWNVEDR